MKKTMKRLLAVLLSVVMLTAALPVFAFKLGDADGDKLVSAADARMALRLAVGLEEYYPGSNVFSACDANGDGTVTAEDARLILRYAVGLETTLHTGITEACDAFSLTLPETWKGHYVCERSETDLRLFMKLSSGKKCPLFGVRLVPVGALSEYGANYEVCRYADDNDTYYVQQYWDLDPDFDWETLPEADMELLEQLNMSESRVLDSLQPLGGATLEPIDYSGVIGDYASEPDENGNYYELYLMSAELNMIYTELIFFTPDGDAAYTRDMVKMDGSKSIPSEDGSISLELKTDSVKVKCGLEGDSPLSLSEPITLKRKPAPAEQPRQKRDSAEIYKLASAFTYEVTASSEMYESTGTAFAINQEGWLVTNYHVIENARSIMVTSLAGEIDYAEKVIAFDRDLDLAIIKIQHVRAWATLNKNSCVTGERIYTLGSSKGLTGSFSDGVVAEKSRFIDDLPVQFIQISAPISPGNSGGPLLNEYGEVIGVNSRTYNEGQNLNFAIPVWYLDELDTDSPMEVWEFGDLEYEWHREQSGIPYSDEASVFTPVEELLLWPHGAGFVPIYAYCPEEDYSITFDINGEGVSCMWSNWMEDNSLRLFVTAEEGAKDVTVNVFITEMPEVACSFTVTATQFGTEDAYYLSDTSTLVPDAGAVFGVTPYTCAASGDATLFTATYDGDSLLATEKSPDELRAAYEERLQAYGFEQTDVYEDEEMRVFSYSHAGNEVALNYYEFYYEGTLSRIDLDIILLTGEGEMEGVG